MGLIPHAAWSRDARGSSTALMIPFVAEIDPAYARRLYSLLVGSFETRLAGVLPAILEHPRGVKGTGDVDSGPLVGGASGPGSVVGIAAAITAGDKQGATALRASTEALGFPVEWRGRRWYGLAQLPVGDAFLAWASVQHAAVRPSPVQAFADWRLRWALVCCLVIGGGVLGLVCAWPPRPKAR